MVRVWRLKPVAMRALLEGAVGPIAMEEMEGLEHLVSVTRGHCSGGHS